MPNYYKERNEVIAAIARYTNDWGMKHNKPGYVFLDPLDFSETIEEMASLAEALADGDLDGAHSQYMGTSAIIRRYLSPKLQTLLSKKLIDLKRQRFAVTGILSKPREFYKDLIEESNGEFHTKVTSTTTFLVVGDEVGNAKIREAGKFGTKVINEAKLKAMLGL